MPLLTRSLSTGGSLAAALALLVVLTLALALWASRGPALAQDASTLGIDTLPGINSKDFIGAVQTCSEAEVGDQVTVDVFVRDVESLAAWELRVDFDQNILNIDPAQPDYEFFLVSASSPTGSTGSIFPALFDYETPGRYFLAAANFRGEPDSGSGVLARVQFTAVAEGRGSLTITSDPGFLRPRLTAGSGRIIGDSDGDGLWDSAITGGEIAVGQPCTEPQPPEPTPPPPTPPPDGDSEPEPDEGTGTADDDSPATGPAVVSAVPPLISLSDTEPSGSGPSGGDPSASDNDDGSSGPDGDDPSDASGDDGSSAATDGEDGAAGADGEDAVAGPGGEGAVWASNGESDEGTTIVDVPGSQPDAEGAEDGTTESSRVLSAADGSGSSGPPWWLLGAILGVALVVGTGGTIVLHALRTR